MSTLEKILAVTHRSLRSLVLLTALCALTGCNACGEEPPSTNNTGQNNTANNTTVNNTTMNNTTTTSTTTTPTTGDEEVIEAMQRCAGSGVSSGGGVRAVHCLGPDHPSGARASGGGVRWQPGATRVIVP
jgi:predicted small lipoprotein YifL